MEPPCFLGGVDRIWAASISKTRKKKGIFLGFAEENCGPVHLALTQLGVHTSRLDQPGRKQPSCHELRVVVPQDWLSRTSLPNCCFSHYSNSAIEIFRFVSRVMIPLTPSYLRPM